MSFRKQPGSCKDDHFRVSSVISILRSSASLPWLLQMTRRFWPHLWRSNTLQCWLCCTPSKWGLQSIRIICITIICAACLALKDVFLEVPFADHLQVWCSSSMATKHVWETRIPNTTHYWWPIPRLASYPAVFNNLSALFKDFGDSRHICFAKSLFIAFKATSDITMVHMLYPPLDVSNATSVVIQPSITKC